MKKLIYLMILTTLLIFPAQETWAKESHACQPVKEIIKTGVSVNKGVCQMHITRKEPQVMMMGQAISPNMMDLGLFANFQVFDKKAEVIGEFALLGEEVNPVLDSLRKGGIEISAIHNHMIGENPTIYFLHFEGMGDIKTLAKAVKEAVDKVSYQ